MAQIGDAYKIYLDDLMEMNNYNRTLPEVDYNGKSYWRYLADDDEGQLCLYTYDDMAGYSNLEYSIDNIASATNIFPAVFNGIYCDVVDITDEGNIVLRARTADGLSYTVDGSYIPDFVLTPQECEYCLYGAS